MSVTWLHVSDFHIRGGDPYDRDVVLGALIRSVRELRERDGRKPDLIFATGDVAHSGKASEYEPATMFFEALLEAAAVERRHLFVIPGNHDVDRSQGIGLARTLESEHESYEYFGPAIVKPHLTQKLGAFRDWYNQFFEGIREFPTDTTCGPVEVVDLRGARIAMLPLNTAPFCQDDYDHNRLILGRRCLGIAIEQLNRVNAQLKVALAHHPLDWLRDFERGNIKASLHGAVDVVLNGHLHETDVVSVVATSGGVLHMTAGACYQTRRFPNRALYSVFEAPYLRVFPIRYEDSPTEIWTVDPSVFPRDEGYEKRLLIPRFTEPVAAALREVIVGPPEPAQTPRFRSNIPSRGDLAIIGRDHLLKGIEAALGDPGRERLLVLHGPPGVGKSELAREFARRQRDRYPGGTFLIRTGGGAELVDLAHIGASVLGLQFPAGLSLQDQCERTFLSFGAAPLLLIYDNVVKQDDIEPWLPRSGMPCHVLITTLNERLSAAWRTLEVPLLTREASLELVERVAGRDVAERHGPALVALAGGLPIQIVPASRTLAYEARRGRSDRAAPGVSAEAQHSFYVVHEALEHSIRVLLHAAAILNCQRIVRKELFLHLEQECRGSEGEFERRLDVCLDLHLLDGADELRMHQLFASFLLGLRIDHELQETLGLVRRRQRERFVDVARSVAAMPASRDVVAALLTYSLNPSAWDQTEAGISIADGEAVGSALIAIGKFEEARPWYERAVAEAERGDVHGRVDHQSLGTSLHQVGVCLSSVGKFEEARPWYERAVAEAERGDVHGRVDHESLGTSLHQVGICLSSVGKFEEARPWYERAVAEAERGDVHGRVDHQSLGRSLHQVGICLSSVGKFEEARPWYERAVAEAERGDVHGRLHHQSLGTSLHQVGICLSSVGKFEEARPWYERAVAEKERGDVHGRVDHQSLGTSLRQLGICLSSVGKFEEARPWYERAVAEKERGDVYGRVDHQSLALSLAEGADCLRQLGLRKQAQDWERRASELRLRSSRTGL
jgi:tetratricopeptide (TPR) repeat protein/predicted phosphodiesterase